MTDQIIRGIAADRQVRIDAINGRDLVSEMKNIHSLSRVATAALGRQIMMTALMSVQLKNEGDKVSTIIRGNGYASNLVCTGTPGGMVKGYTSAPDTELPPTAAGKLDVAGYVGSEGQLTVVRDLPVGEPYVGVCNLISGEIAVDFAEYYTVSEQQPSLVYLGVRMDAADGVVRAAGGLLVQPLPGCDDDVIDALQAKSEAIGQMSFRLDNGESLEEILQSIFGDLGYEITDTAVPCYRCDCSRNRIEKALISIGEEELLQMIHEDHGAEVNCHFCNRKYRFSEEDLLHLLSEAKGEPNDRDE